MRMEYRKGVGFRDDWKVGIICRVLGEICKDVETDMRDCRASNADVSSSRAGSMHLWVSWHLPNL